MRERHAAAFVYATSTVCFGLLIFAIPRRSLFAIDAVNVVAAYHALFLLPRRFAMLPPPPFAAGAVTPPRCCPFTRLPSIPYFFDAFDAYAAILLVTSRHFFF